MTAPRFRLITLGRIALETPDGEDADLGRRKRKLALLAVLALSPRPLTRESLATMFWGDQDVDRARHSLSDTLSHLRRVLGRDAILTHDGFVALATPEYVAVDAIEMERAALAGDRATVCALYQGPFLARLGVEDSPSFEDWVRSAREKYDALFERANAPPEPVTAVPHAPSRTGRRRFASVLAGATTIAAAAGLLTALLIRPSSARTPNVAPLVALTDVFTDPSDTSLAWLSDGFEHMMAADLGRVASAGIVAPSLVRGTSSDPHHRDSLSGVESIARARQLHADWASSAVIRRDGGNYVVTITLRDVATRHESHYAISGEDILAVADASAARLLAALEVNSKGPHLSDIETANTDAYRHFIEGEDAEAQSDSPRERRELDAAIAEDSNFTSAIVARLAIADSADFEHLQPLLARARPRMTAWDRIGTQIFEARHSAHPKRAETLARERASSYPRDPRSWQSLGDMYVQHGSYAAAESAYARLLSLDASSPSDASPCWTCAAYSGLMAARHGRGDVAGEIALAHRYSELRPADRYAWLYLANVLDLNGDLSAAQSAYSRYLQLVPGNDGFDPFVGRMLLLARRYDEAERYARKYMHAPEASEASDLLESVLRERGQYVDAIAQFDAQRAREGHLDMELVRAQTLAASGQPLEARKAIEQYTWHPRVADSASSQYAYRARGYAWHHALLADAMRSDADTTFLRGLADSIEHIGAWSDYARDWSLHHHIRGLIAERAGRFGEARTEFEAALSPVRGWTRTNIELARVDIALGEPARAIEVLRAAYREPLDAMGRYAPRSELDFQMALAFSSAKQADSAHVYASYVRSAWVHADPVVVSRLGQIASIQ